MAMGQYINTEISRANPSCIYGQKEIWKSHESLTPPRRTRSRAAKYDAEDLGTVDLPSTSRGMMSVVDVLALIGQHPRPRDERRGLMPGKRGFGVVRGAGLEEA